MRHQLSLTLSAVFATLPLGSVVAQIAESGYSLPLTLALKAATASIASCASTGYPVSVVVVDPSGVVKLEAKGDHSTIHTTASAFPQGLHGRDPSGRSSGLTVERICVAL